MHLHAIGWKETDTSAPPVEDDFVVAVATDAPAQLPVPTGLPVLDLNSPSAVADFLLEHAHRFEYDWAVHGAALPIATP